mmetsp:Transcript_22255/g.33228  ORF Transcript_22255/g.33228 Transcript_22255/m.33228 type:complete len:105 (+) Transcript_22255:1095-1409(+)
MIPSKSSSMCLNRTSAALLLPDRRALQEPTVEKKISDNVSLFGEMDCSSIIILCENSTLGFSVYESCFSQTPPIAELLHIKKGIVTTIIVLMMDTRYAQEHLDA